jgi:hypothetical protein
MIGIRQIGIFIVLVTILLPGCHVKTPSMPNTPNAYSLCTQKCAEIASNCKLHCVDNCQNCTKKMKTDAAKRFRQYQYEQYIRGCPDTRELNSYQDPLRCSKVSCSCAADKKMCDLSCQVQYLPST